MLTCVVGKNLVDTFSFKDEKLREWSNKAMLKCPVCNEKMVYCHGDFKIPYFRHEKNNDCPDVYSEGITEEHLKGTRILYEWLKNQEGIINLQLEKWISETKQRPDIYFERKEGNIIKKYAIEFQCSPIATKYNERHDLYRLNNINDIWILGTYKYDIRRYNKLFLKYDMNNKIIDNIKTKTLEREIKFSSKPVIYLTEDRIIKIIDDFIETYDENYNERKTIFDLNLDIMSIKNCTLNNIMDMSSLYLEDNTIIHDKIAILEKHISTLNKNIGIYEYTYNIRIKENDIEANIIKNDKKRIYNTSINNVNDDVLLKLYKKEFSLNELEIYWFRKLQYSCKLLNDRFKMVNKDCQFVLEKGSSLYLYKIEFDSPGFNRIFYIKHKSTDCTMMDSYTTSFRGKHGGVGWRRHYYDKTIDKLQYNKINCDKIIEYVSNTISNTLRKYKYGSV